MAKFKPYKIESSELASLEREEGQFIVTTDTQKIYLDSDDSNRIELGGKDGTVTSIATGAGLTGGTITNSGTIKANLKSEIKSTLAATSMGSTANRQYAVGIDKNDKLSVNIPWTDNNTTYSLTQDSSDGHKITLTPSSGTAQIVTIPDNNTTYTFATGDNNGEIKVTPSGGSAQGVAVKGLNNAAYKDIDSSISAASTSTKLPTSQAVASFVEGKGYTTNTGTITGVSVNGTSVATSGTANITSVPASILTGAIPSSVTATTQSQGDNSTKIATTAYVDTAIDNLPEPMVFKGSLGTGGTVTSLPVDGSATIGDTYKVITDGTYASKAAKVGDTFICLTKTSNANTWELIPSGDEPSGTVTSVTIKATSPINIDSNSAITTSGTRTLSHANSGVTAGTYKSVTVNATGHVTAGSNPTTISGYGITDAKIANGTITLGSNTITPLTSSSIGNVSIAGLPHGFQITGPIDGQITVNGIYTLDAACAKGVDTSISAASTSTNLPTSQAVASFVEGKGYLTSEINSNIVNGSATGSLRTLDTHTGVIIGQGAFQQGYLTQAAGDYSHAEGYGCVADGNYSHAEGYNTGALDAYQHVEGKWNIEDQTSLHIVGNGTAYGSESNAYTLDKQGNGWFAGDVYVGSTSGTNKDSGSVKLAKVSELPSAGTGINIANSVVTNTGVVNIETSPSAAGNGTIAVTKGTTSGTNTTYVSVKGLNNAAYKNVDTSISAASTSINLPTSAAVAAFVEGKGYVTTNTTYTLSADTTNNKITLTPNSGTAQSITVPYATSAGTATATSGTLTIQKNGTNITTFNGSTATANILVPTVYTGTSAPSASTGSNGDIYIQTS